MEDRANQWIEKVDPSSGKVYWGNVVTKATTWVEPTEVKEWRDSTLQESYWECFDPKSKRSYYLNQSSGKSTWLKPSGKIQRRHAESVFKKGDTRGVTDPSLPKGWVACSDPRSQKTYYYNRETGETTWNCPGQQKKGKRGTKTKNSKKISPHKASKNRKWKSVIDPATKRVYYVNTKTNETRWSIPLEDDNETETIQSHSSTVHQNTDIESKFEEKSTSSTSRTRDKTVKKSLAGTMFGSIRGAFSGTQSSPERFNPSDPLIVEGKTSPTLLSNGKTATFLPDGVVTGPMLKLSNRVAKGFQPRYCVLKNDYLLYYKTESKFQKGAEPNGHVDLKKASAVLLSSDVTSTEKYTIEIVTRDRVWKFAIETLEDMQVWLESLQLAAKNSQAGLGAKKVWNGSAGDSKSSDHDDEWSGDETETRSYATDGLRPEIQGVIAGGSAEEIVTALRQNRIRYDSTDTADTDSGLDTENESSNKQDITATSPRRIHSSLHHRGGSTWRGPVAPVSLLKPGSSSRAGRYSGAADVLMAQLHAMGIRSKVDVELLKENTAKAFTMWLQSERIMHLENALKDAGYDDLVLLVRLTEEDIHKLLRDELGVEKPGHRMRVVVAIRQLRDVLISTRPVVENEN